MDLKLESVSTSLLSKINSPSDLRKLSVDQLPQLCSEIREFLISHLSQNPGHFASSMGAVDLIVALHYVYNTPDDRLVWDVGHQAYAHKILTGRKEAFAHQRTLNGISGFPNPLESEADTFMAGHAVTFAGGLAAGGKKPFVAIYSSFLQRAYDNIIHDVAIQGLPVTFCIDRAGIVGEDGVTHHGLFDLPYLNCIPGMKIASPADEETMRNLMFTSLSLKSPLAIRYPRGKATKIDWKSPMHEIEIGKGRKIIENNNSRIAVLTLGPSLHDAVKASEILSDSGIVTDVFDMIWMKPIDEEILLSVVKNYKAVVTIEDGALEGGFGSVVLNHFKALGSDIPVKSLGVPDRWIAQGTVNELKHICGYDIDNIVSSVKEIHSNLLKQ